ncbi:MAG: DNA gyrase subunit A [Candidatus Sericytochromatia bacterium]
MTNELSQKIKDIDIREEMKQSFMDYAMSVIVSRALPDVRDGLKPVHRRILYSMYELNNTPDKPFKKSARIVGEVMGKYHPHGDSSIYEATVRLAQDFSTRYLLVDGQGNFGSIDEDPPAAMRYTEARLSKNAMEMINDIEANTVDWSPNFDNTLEEPRVLPALLPNLLLNGANGIAVGMATSIPPHNLREVVEAILHLVDNKDATIQDLMNFVKGPDFPTGGIILGDKGIKQAYMTGRGQVTVRSVANIEENKKGRQSIVVTEIPYQVSKKRIIEQIADLVKDAKLEGISDLRDESDKDGMRLVIEIKRDAVAHVVLNNLYKYTLLQTTFSTNMLAIVKGQPKVLNLREVLKNYLEHRIDVIRRRTTFFLDKAQARDHIVQGLLIVQDNIDNVIKDIRSSQTTGEAHDLLVSKYALSSAQATAVLDMQLRRITALEKKKLEDEHNELLAKITDYQDILARDERVDGIIKEEVSRLIEKSKDVRRTQLLPDPGELTDEDLIPDEQMAIFMTDQGYIKRVPLNQFEEQKKGGRGKGGLTTRENDFVKHFFVSSNHASILFFSNLGKAYDLKVYELPEASRQAKGSNIANLLELTQDEKITAVIPVTEFKEGSHLVMLTRNGVIKKSDLTFFKDIRARGLIAIGLDEGDSLNWVGLSDGNSHIIIGTKKGYSIRFSEEDVRSMGRNARGVKSITLREGDQIVSLDILSGDLLNVSQVDEAEDEIETEVETEEELENSPMVNYDDALPKLLTVTTEGKGKRTPVSFYRVQSRGGRGIINIKLKKNSEVASILLVQPEDQIMIATLKGVVIRQKVSEIRTMGRSTQGVILQKLSGDDKVITVQLVVDSGEEEVLEEN